MIIFTLCIMCLGLATALVFSVPDRLPIGSLRDECERQTLARKLQREQMSQNSSIHDTDNGTFTSVEVQESRNDELVIEITSEGIELERQHGRNDPDVVFNINGMHWGDPEPLKSCTSYGKRRCLNIYDYLKII